MQSLFQSFMEIPVDTLKFQGLVQFMVVSAALIFKCMLPAPKKVKLKNSNGK